MQTWRYDRPHRDYVYKQAFVRGSSSGSAQTEERFERLMGTRARLKPT